jgi:hypothetical protein
MPLLASGTALAQTPSVALAVKVDPDGRTVSGTEEVTLAPGPDGQALFYLYANRFAVRPAGLTDVNFYWHYPTRFSTGAMHVSAVTQDGKALDATTEDLDQGGAETLLRVRGIAAAAGAQVTLELTFDVDVPQRFGDFGCTGGVCVLMGGFYPMLVARDAKGSWDVHGLPGRASYRLSLDGPAGAQVVALGQVGALDEKGHIDLATDADQAYAAVVLSTAGLYRSERTAAGGVNIIYLSTTGSPPPDPPAAQPPPLPSIPEDYAGMALAALSRAVDVMVAAGGRPDPTRPLIVCEVPLRDQIAEAHPGVVLASDRIFRIFPVAAFRRFHELALVRAAFALEAELEASPFEARDDLSWAPDAGGAYLTDVYTLTAFGKAVFAGDILKYVSFVPQIDQILYASTIEFTPAYFQSIYEADPFRDDLARWNNQLPRGKLVYEKLRDLLGTAGVVRLFHDWLGGQPIRDAAEAAYGKPLAWFFAQWLGPVPRVNYRLVSWSSDPSPTGGYDNTITVDKQGDSSLIEPVVVELEDADGGSTRLTWDGHGASHDLATHTAAEVKVVTLDPDGRLVEDDLGENVDPRFDNRSPPRLKLLYNSLGADYDAGHRKLEVSVDFNLWRVYDLHNSIRLAPYKTFTAEFGLLVEYDRFFGRKADPHRLAGVFSSGLSAARLDPTYTPGAPSGTALSLVERVGWDDRDYLFEPWRDNAASVGGALSATHFDHGGTAATWWLGGSASAVRTPIDGTTLGALVGTDVVGGDVQSNAQRLAVGGPSGLRGYGSNALLGRAAARGSVELRQTIVHDLNVNLLHFSYLRGIGAALFADGATVSACDGYRLFGGGSFYADAGGSARFFFDNAGASQAMV